MFEDKKSIRKPIKDVYIPEKDENISTREVRERLWYQFNILIMPPSWLPIVNQSFQTSHNI